MVFSWVNGFWLVRHGRDGAKVPDVQEGYFVTIDQPLQEHGGRFEEGRGKRKEEHREPHAPEPVLFMLDKECKEHRYNI